MAKIVLVHDNGETEVLRNNVSDKIESYDVLLRGDYIAMKLWSVEDIESMLMDYDDIDIHKIAEEIASTQENLKHLEDCTNEDWRRIEACIEDYFSEN